MITLVQTGKLVKKVPIFAVGKEYWQPLFDWIKKDIYLKHQAINKKDLEIVQIVDSAEEVLKKLKK